MRRGPTIKGFYLEWEGLRVFGAIDSMDVPNELEIRFTSPQPPTAALTHADGKLSERIRLVHGDVNTTQHGENYARISIHGATPESSILVYNEYPVGSPGTHGCKAVGCWLNAAITVLRFNATHGNLPIGGLLLTCREPSSCCAEQTNKHAKQEGTTPWKATTSVSLVYAAVQCRGVICNGGLSRG